MKAILNLGKKTVVAIANKPEYAALFAANGSVVDFVTLPQPVLNKKLLQSTITLSSGEQWTVFLSQLEVLEEGTLSLTSSQINVLKIHGDKFISLINNNGQSVYYQLNKKDSLISHVFINNEKFEVLSSSIFYK